MLIDIDEQIWILCSKDWILDPPQVRAFHAHGLSIPEINQNVRSKKHHILLMLSTLYKTFRFGVPNVWLHTQQLHEPCEIQNKPSSFP